jgi:hypothetical protein
MQHDFVRSYLVFGYAVIERARLVSIKYNVVYQDLGKFYSAISYDF